MLKELLEKALLYKENQLEVSKVIEVDCPKAIKELASIPSSFKVYGSTRTGNFAQVPWFGVFDKDITESAQRGYYIVYLLNANMTGICLSLNQGWTDFKEKFGATSGKVAVKKTASYCRSLIRSSLEGFSDSDIDLNATTPLAKGYELGHIYGKYYQMDSIPDDIVLVNDLRGLMGVYAELKGYLSQYGAPITELLKIVQTKELINELTEDIEFQEEVEVAEPVEISQSPQSRPMFKTEGTLKKWNTNPSIAKKALSDAKFLCEIDSEHKTFNSKVTDCNYVEAHHLVPMRLQENFENSLDVPANITALCPNCHRLLHHAKHEEKLKLLEYLLTKRKDNLAIYGIDVNFSELMRGYE